MGFNQNGTFGFGGGGTGGGGGGTTLVPLKVVAGEPGGPVPGQTIYSNAALQGTIMNFIVVNNLIELDFGPSPAFSFDDETGEIDRAPNQWVDGDTLYVQAVLPNE